MRKFCQKVEEKYVGLIWRIDKTGSTDWASGIVVVARSTVVLAAVVLAAVGYMYIGQHRLART